MSQYAGITASAAALLARKGAVVTLRQTTVGTYDPVTQVDATATTVDTSVHAVLLPVGDSRRFAPGELIRRHMMEAWMAAQNITVTPQPGNQLIFGSTTWNIVSVTEYAPDGGSPIAWRAYVER